MTVSMWVLFVCLCVCRCVFVPVLLPLGKNQLDFRPFFDFFPGGHGNECGQWKVLNRVEVKKSVCVCVLGGVLVGRWGHFKRQFFPSVAVKCNFEIVLSVWFLIFSDKKVCGPPAV